MGKSSGFLVDDGLRIEPALKKALESEDKGALGRVIFYGLLKQAREVDPKRRTRVRDTHKSRLDPDNALGEARIEVDSDVGMGFLKLAGESFPRRQDLSPKDLYDWWLANRDEYGRYDRLDEWLESNWVQKHLIPNLGSSSKEAETTAPGKPSVLPPMAPDGD